MDKAVPRCEDATMTGSETRLEHVRVHDVMHTGVLTTDPTTPLRVVARLMVEQRVHAVAVADPDHSRRPFGIVSALDVVAAAAGGVEETAGQAASTGVVTVSSADSLAEAARVMAEHTLTHLIVVDPAAGHPIGVLSALDVAAAYADS
jgi:predicted transcriptional regulator